MIDPRLLEWARLPGPAKVLAAARRRLESGHGLSGRPLRVPLTAAERSDVGRLLGVTWALSGRGVGARALADAVASLGTDLATLLTALDGPLRDRPGERSASRQKAIDERDRAHAQLLIAGVPAETVAGWLAKRGLPTAGTGRLIDLARRCAAVWKRLPAPGESVLLTVLAAQATDDPHALDRGTRLASAVLRLAHHPADPPTDAESWRTAWEELGVVCDPVSSRVLVLNLRLYGDAPACRLTEAAGAEPLWLTWRSLTGTIRTNAPVVYVCENPSIVVAAADRLRDRSHPLVCTNGRPSAATRRLLTQIAHGTRILLHADDDLGGQAIVAGLHELLPGSGLWRYTRRAPSRPRYEEQDLDLLLADLVHSTNHLEH